MLFFYILLLLSTGSLYSCHQLINPHQFEQLLDAKQAETSAYFNEFARIFRNDEDPIYRQYKAEFEESDQKIDLTLQTIHNVPTHFPHLLCSEQTQHELYTAMGIKPEASHKPLLINQPGMGMNPGAMAQIAIFLDEKYHQENKDTQSDELAFTYNHENGHIFKYQPDASTLKDIKFAELYVQKLQQIPIYAHERTMAAQLIETVKNAKQILNYCHEWGADLHATKVCSPASIQKTIAAYRALNLPDCITHPGTFQRADLIENNFIEYFKKPSTT